MQQLTQSQIGILKMNERSKGSKECCFLCKHGVSRRGKTRRLLCKERFLLVIKFSDENTIFITNISNSKILEINF